MRNNKLLTRMPDAKPDTVRRRISAGRIRPTGRTRPSVGGLLTVCAIAALTLFAAPSAALAQNRTSAAATPRTRAAAESAGAAADAPAPGEPMVRELLVPFADLGEILREPGVERIMMSRKEFNELLKKAQKTTDAQAPHKALLTSADYQATIADGRAEIVGQLLINVLEPGLHALPLEFGGIGLRRAELDGKAAALGVADDARLMLLLEGKGEHRLVLQMTTPVQTMAATQAVNIQLPVAPASALKLSVDGDVELRSGAAIISRDFDADKARTSFVLLPKRGPMNLVLTLNSRQKRTERLLVSRSLMIAEVTESYERLHAAVSTAVMHMGIDRLRFALPDGFEVTEVSGVHVSRWAVSNAAAGDDRRILEVSLREETTDTVVVNIVAMRRSGDLSNWSFPKLQPLDVVSRVALTGLLVEDRLKAENIRHSAMAPVNVSVLNQGLPASVAMAAEGGISLRPVVAYYAAQGDFDLTAAFTKPPARLLVTSNLLLTMEDQGLTLHGGFSLLPQEEKLFSADVIVPRGWDVTAVKDAENKPLKFQRHEHSQGTRLNIRFAPPVAAGGRQSINFSAVSVPGGWLDEWSQDITLVFPRCYVVGATRDIGAIAIDARDDLAVTAATSQLTPLDEAEKAEYGLSAAPTALAYQYDEQPWSADLTVRREEPLLKARTASLLKLSPGELSALYDVAWDISRGRAATVSFALPATTPEAISVIGRNVQVKETTSSVQGDSRIWKVVLDRPRLGSVALRVVMSQPLEGRSIDSLTLPLIRAAGVENQTGLAAVEGSDDLDVRILAPSPRRVDVGELAAAGLPIGRRLLGAFSLVDESESLRVSLNRPAIYSLPTAIVQRAEISTVLSDRGVAQVAARYLLNTRAQFLEVALPAGATLWAVSLDGTPLQPQRDGDQLLIGLAARKDDAASALIYNAQLQQAPAGAPAQPAANSTRDLVIVYAMPEKSLGLYTGLKLAAPQLVLRDDADGRQQVPTADLIWRLYLPEGYQAVRAEGFSAQSGLANNVLLAHTDKLQLLSPAGEAADFSIHNTEDQWGCSPAEESSAPAAVNRRADRLTDVEAATRPRNQNDLDATGSTSQALQQRIPATDFAAGEALRSLNIDLMPIGSAVVLQSLGGRTELSVTLAAHGRLRRLGLALGLGVLLIGLTLTCRRLRIKLVYVVAVALVAMLLPPVIGRFELAALFNPALIAAIVLAVWYVVAALWLRCSACVRRRFGLRAAATSASVVIIAALAVFGAGAADCLAADTANPTTPYTIQIVEPPAPLVVPHDAILIPYDPERLDLKPDQLFVPMQQFRRLYNAAHPDAALALAPPPVPYALAGASYTARLTGDEMLTIDGSLEIDIFVDDYITVMLPLEGGVLARADVNGKPARLGVITTPVTPIVQKRTTGKITQPQTRQIMPQQAANAAMLQPGKWVLLHLQGKGRHKLELSVRLQMQRRGGWRMVAGRIPSAPAAEIALHVPDSGTELLLDQVRDKRQFETDRPDQIIHTVVGPGGEISLQWRPKISQAQVDTSMTCRSAAVVDIQEDRVRLIWDASLQLRSSQRESLSFTIPEGYLIEKVAGANVRGWQLHKDANPPRLDVSLLKASAGNEQISLLLWQPRPAREGRDEQDISIPAVAVPEAMRHTGIVTIRRSPLLELVTRRARGLRRTDLPPVAAAIAAESLLGVEPYQAYEFTAPGFEIVVSAQPIEAEISAELQAIVRLAQRRRELESRILLNVQRRPIYEIAVHIPANLQLEKVLAPGQFEWAVTDVADDKSIKLLTVYLANGGQGQVPLVMQGRFDDRRQTSAVTLPTIRALGVRRQQGHIVIQADPAIEVTLAAAAPAQGQRQRDIEVVPRQSVAGWLSAEQMAAAKLVLRTKSADYAGQLSLRRRVSVIKATSITNVRVTDREIQETILLDFTINEAGARQFNFILPGHMRQARIQAPLLKRTAITPVTEEPDSPVRVSLELQDDVMHQLRVLIENDRPLKRGHGDAPIPVIETGDTLQQFVALESAGRDEVVIKQADELEPLGRQQREWQTVSELFRGGSTRAYMVKPSAREPRLSYAMQRRQEVKTADAAIELAEALLVVDSAGAFRGVQTFHVDNRTEQFLEVRLPDGATLWTVHVAGSPVKPVLPPGADKKAPGRTVLVPLVKMSAGDLNYTVVLKYGGRLNTLGSLRKVEFPFIQAVNLSVGVSQVRLWLPDDFRWFDFDGSMRLVEEDTLKKQRYSYEGAQVKKLADVMASNNEYAKSRVSRNLEALGRDENWRNKETLEKVQLQVKELRDVSRSDRDAYDNRGGFKDAFQRQSNVRSEQMKNIDEQWSDHGEVQTKGDGQVDEKNAADRWLHENALTRRQSGKPAELELMTPSLRMNEQQAYKSEFGDSKPKFNLTKRLEVYGDLPGSSSGLALDDSDSERPRDGLVYPPNWQELTAKRKKFVMQSTGEPSTTVPFGVGRGSAAASGGFVAGGGATFGWQTGGESGGVASLDVEIPQRGREYRFTTPRGEVAIAARPVARSLVGSLTRIGLIVLGLVAVTGVIFLVIRLRRRFDDLVLAGAAVLLLGAIIALVEPLAGIVVMIVATLMIVCGIIRTRAASETAPE